MVEETTIAPVNETNSSWVWRYYRKEQREIEGSVLQTVAICTVTPAGSNNECGKTYTHGKGSSTSNLTRHLNNSHLIFREAHPQSGTMDAFIQQGYFREVGNRHISIIIYCYHSRTMALIPIISSEL